MRENSTHTSVDLATLPSEIFDSNEYTDSNSWE